MLQSVTQPKSRVQAGIRPVALLILAFGVAIGASLPSEPARPFDGLASNAAADRKRVRVIPLTARDDLAMLGR